MDRFNLTQFNIRSNYTVKFKDVIKTDLSAILVAKVTATFNDNLYTRLNIRLTQGIIKLVPFFNHCTTTLQGEGKFFAKLALKPRFYSNLVSKIKIYKTIYFTDKVQSQLLNRSLVAKRIYYKDSVTLGLKINSNVGRKIIFKDAIFGILLGRCDIINTQTAIISLPITIKPGQTLRISSERYTVYLDNDSVLHLHSGDWVMLDRNLCDIVINFGISGKAQTTISYTERWL